MQKILIAIDYSLAAQTVVEQGNALAKVMKAEIVLLHVIEDLQYYASTVYNPIMGFGGFVNTNFLSDDVKESIQKETLVFLEKTKKHLKNNNIKLKVAHGDIVDAILDTAKKENCQLIVLGTKSRNGFEEFFLGSTAHQLLKQARIPMYLIPVENEK
jgi:nucleotide-binding universal stress UspA family protein